MIIYIHNTKFNNGVKLTNAYAQYASESPYILIIVSVASLKIIIFKIPGSIYNNSSKYINIILY